MVGNKMEKCEVWDSSGVSLLTMFKNFTNLSLYQFAKREALLGNEMLS